MLAQMVEYFKLMNYKLAENSQFNKLREYFLRQFCEDLKM